MSAPPSASLSSGAQVTPTSPLADYWKIDRLKIHTITGPMFVKDAQPGDGLELEIRRSEHRNWGGTSLVNGLGSLPDRFPQPHLFIWRLDGDFATSLAPVKLPLAPFLGIVGVCPPAPGEHRPRPPGPFGGNLEVRDLLPSPGRSFPPAPATPRKAMGKCASTVSRGRCRLSFG